MKCKIPEISWHNRDPVLSVDIQPSNGSSSAFYRLASGGTDSHVLIWYMSFNEDKSELLLDVAADLTRHQKAVNVVKWSPNSELLASGDDESVIFIWKQKPESEPLNIVDSSGEQDKEVWITLKVLRGHVEDVYDLSWCPQSLYLVSGSVDNSAIIWDVYKGKSLAILNDHKGFVQGVAWDPKNQYIVTLSTDRFLRVFDIQTKKVLFRVNKASLPVPEGNELYGKRMRIYHDDTLQTFFRRLCFSPDGKLLLTPAGVSDYDGVTHPLHMSYIYSRYALKQPAIVLPCPDQYTVAIKCCPILFKLRPLDAIANPPVIPLPYRMIFAIATRCSVYLYDTQQQQPFGIISNIHYTRLTDISWSSDGRIIVVSSTDGFCSLITFERGELGDEYKESIEVLTQIINKETSIKERKLTKPKEFGRGRGKCSFNEDKAKVEKNIKSLENERNNESRTPNSIQASSIAEKMYPKSNKFTYSANSADKNEGSINKLEQAEETATYISCRYSRNQKLRTNTKPDKEKNPSILTNKAISLEKVTEKEILSSNEKFHSPEKKYRPVTPISIRRHKRLFNTTANTINSVAGDKIKFEQTLEQATISLLPRDVNSPRQEKSATSVTICRSARSLQFPPTLMDKTPLLDEAMDAWPFADEDSQGLKQIEKLKEVSGTSHKDVIGNTLYRTENICPENKVDGHHIVMLRENGEGTEVNTTKDSGILATEPSTPNSLKALPIENSESNTIIPLPAKAIENNTLAQSELIKTHKTPRRVALKTISIPKSKKV